MFLIAVNMASAKTFLVNRRTITPIMLGSIDNITYIIDTNVTSSPGRGSDSIVQGVLVTAYTIIGALGFLSNMFVLYLILSNKFMRVKYIFTASISFAHILMCMLAIPLIITCLFKQYDFLPCATQIVVCFFTGCTSFSMLATAVRRSLALSQRFRYANFTYRGKVANIVVIWIGGFATALPFMAHCEGHLPFDMIQAKQFPSNEPRTNMWYYSVVMCCAQIGLPVLVSLLLHISSYYSLKARPVQTHWVKELKINQQHIAMLLVFAVCWVPLVCLNLVTYHVTAVPQWLSTSLPPIAISSVLYNPILYFFLNAHIRHEMELWFVSTFNRAHT